MGLSVIGAVTYELPAATAALNALGESISQPISKLAVIILLFILVPSLIASVSVLVPIGALISIGAARILYKKGKV